MSPVAWHDVDQCDDACISYDHESIPLLLNSHLYDLVMEVMCLYVSFHTWEYCIRKLLP